MVGAETYDQVKRSHKGWVKEYLGDGENNRDDKWTKSIAVGSKGFVENVKKFLGAIGRGRSLSASRAFRCLW